MAGRGPAPKPDEKRQRRNKPEIETTELAAGGKVKAPALPNRRRLSVATRRWWDTWATSPQAAQFLATDWQRLLFLVPIVEGFFNGDLGNLTEIRLNEAKLGGTPEDRLRLRWRMRDADQEGEREAKAATRRSSRSKADPRLKLVEGGG